MNKSNTVKIDNLSLSHKDLLFYRIKDIDTIISEYSFANLYLFRKRHNYKVITFDDSIYLSGITVDNINFVMPLIDLYGRENGDREITKLIDFAKKEDKIIFPVDERWLTSFNMPSDKIYYCEADTDYIYTAEKMCTYKGRKLHKKRNLLKQFKIKYNYKSFPLVKQEVQKAKDVLDVWINQNNLNKADSDYEACYEALEKMDELILCGIIYYVDDDPAGFILGEELRDDTFVVHFAKAKKEYKGIYQFIYNNFAKILPKRYKYLNFEQDLGKDSLRIAKRSYIPDYLLKKYRITP
ncbi:MAG: phosphatidylglycerol lysyltransferase domain-containing protein [Deferribacterota bacterium]|nr:phosphatidylglycerol lysyltransferase domain-containing protein [Deferribacterota bacterium]